jgi:GH18 family chitinase
LSLSVKAGGRVVSLPGSEATIRGFSGASLIVEDEAARVDDALYMAVRPMLATSNGRLILMSTPFGKRGHYWREWSEGKSWQRTEIDATKVSRISSAFLEEEKAAMGSWWFDQEYLCQFKESTDSVFSHDLVMAALSDDIKPLFGGNT